jgi:hypothetical protein
LKAVRDKESAEETAGMDLFRHCLRIGWKVMWCKQVCPCIHMTRGIAFDSMSVEGEGGGVCVEAKVNKAK